MKYMVENMSEARAVIGDLKRDLAEAETSIRKLEEKNRKLEEELKIFKAVEARKADIPNFFKGFPR